jgi:hypothetical protein
MTSIAGLVTYRLGPLHPAATVRVNTSIRYRVYNSFILDRSYISYYIGLFEFVLLSLSRLKNYS